jgi:hypothetical protein
MSRRNRIRAAILDLLQSRDPDASVCPSEAARAVFDDWRPHMDEVRDVAAEMAMDDDVYATQGSDRVSVTDASGPIRLRLVDHPDADGSD